MSAHHQDPEGQQCPRCRRTFVPSCPHCAVDATRREDERRRRAARDRDRAALGLQPLARARMMARWSLRAARIWLTWALRFVPEHDAASLTAALEHVDAAGRELGGV